jgi:hypothetical protein
VPRSRSMTSTRVEQRPARGVAIPTLPLRPAASKPLRAGPAGEGGRRRTEGGRRRRARMRTATGGGRGAEVDGGGRRKAEAGAGGHQPTGERPSRGEGGREGEREAHTAGGQEQARHG